MITRSSIAFEDLLASLIAPKVMPHCLIVPLICFFSLLKRKPVTERPFEVLGGSLGLGRGGGQWRKIVWRGPARKYDPNACFWEFLVWSGVIWGRFGVIWFSIVSSNAFAKTFHISLEKNLGNAIFATLHHFRQTIWGDIKNITLEKKLENTTFVTNNFLTKLNITFSVLTSRADPG